MTVAVALAAWAVVGAIGGWLAGFAVSRDTRFNVYDIVLGMIGAVIGTQAVALATGRLVRVASAPGLLAAFGGAFVAAWTYKRLTGRAPQ